MFDDVTIDRSTTAERIADALRTKILAGELEPGTPLREVALSQSLGVARSTVREAMQLLTAERLLTRSLYRGVVVTELTPADVADIYRARRVLELAGVAATRDVGPHTLDGLREVVERWRDAADRHDIPAIVELHVAFHTALVRLVGSARLDVTYASLLADLKLALATVDRTIDNVAEHFGSHESLLAMLDAGDLDACATEVEHHLAAAQAEVLEHGRLRRD